MGANDSQGVVLLLARHGERERESDEAAPLAPAGRWQAETLGSFLDTNPAIKPDAILCSRVRHAQEHARIVSDLLSKGVPAVPVTALTPRTPDSAFSLAAMRREAATAIRWDRTRTVLCVGHEPRLQQLAEAVAGEKPDTLQHGEALWVEGVSWEALESGRGRIHTRLQPVRPVGDDSDLLPKIDSKIQTSTLLAGFSSAVFSVVLTQSDYWTIWTGGAAWPSGAQGWQAAAIAAGLVLLALATLLFVVAIYMYDRLAMPSRYWEVRDDSWRPRQDLWRTFRRDRIRHNLLYAYMIWIWRFVFSIAVGVAMLGFLILVLHRGVWPIAILYLIVSAGAIAYYRLFRPDLGVD